MGHDSKKKPSAEAWVRGIKHPDILVTNISLSIVKIYLSNQTVNLPQHMGIWLGLSCGQNLLSGSHTNRHGGQS